jgi:hypothetical protein
MFKTIPLADIVNEQCTCRPSVIASGYAFETLLPSCIPRLDLNCSALDIHDLCPELHPYSNIMVDSKALISKLQQDSRLPYPRIPDNDELEYVRIGHYFL